MPLPKLMLLVPQEGYQIDDGEAVLRAKLSSGPSRMRLDFLNAPAEASVTLMLDPTQFAYWRAFYRSTLMRGSLPFLIDLVVDNANVEEQQVQIIPGTYQTSVRGTAHVVQFGLEVKMNPAAFGYEDAILLLYSTYGDATPIFLDRLAQLVNSDFPAALS